MGNTESTGLKMCSGTSLYTARDRTSLKEQMNMQRVGYAQPKQLKTIPAPEFRQRQVSQQQLGQRQRQQQQGLYKELQQPLVVEVLDEPKQQAQQEAPKKIPTFNVYVDCIKDTLRDEKPLPALESEVAEDLETSVKEKGMDCFTGLFGNVIVHEIQAGPWAHLYKGNGLVLYTDINGEKYCEEFDPSSVSKCFPLGITGGDMSKSIWFNDVIERDSCFDAMTAKLKDVSDPPSYEAVTNEPTRYSVSSPVSGFAASSLNWQLLDVTDSETEEESDNPDDHIKVFEGLGGMQVIVHEDNLVLFTDINGKKHCQNYNPHQLSKVFPAGITGGGLPKSIWFDCGEERDLCFALMQWNMDDVDENMEVDEHVQEFCGLYGEVTLKQNGEIEYTSLTGDQVVSTFDPDTLAPTFPMGISYGGLPKTIWFETAEDRQNALSAMREM